MGAIRYTQKSARRLGLVTDADKETHSGAVKASGYLYQVTDCHKHRTLRPADIVRVVEDPADGSLFLFRSSDHTIHRLRDDDHQYVHLSAIDDEPFADTQIQIDP